MAPLSESRDPPGRSGDYKDRRARRHHRRTSSTAELLQSSGRERLDADYATDDQTRRRQRRDDYYHSREHSGGRRYHTDDDDAEEDYRRERRRRRRHQEEQKQDKGDRRTSRNGPIIDSDTSKTTTSGSHALSAGSLAKLNALNDKQGRGDFDRVKLKEKETEVDDVTTYEYEQEVARRERDKELERARERQRERDRKREREQERDQQERQLQRERELEEQKERQREQERKRLRELEKREKENERERERERYREEERDREREREKRRAAKREYYERRRQKSEDRDYYSDKDDYHYRETEKRRVVSGPLLEEGGNYRGRGGGRGRDGDRGHIFNSPSPPPRKRDGDPPDMGSDDGRKRWWKKKWTCIAVAIAVIVLIIAIAVGVTVSKHEHSNSGADPNPSQPANSNLNGVPKSSIPAGAPGYLNPFTWYDTTDFNVTYTDVLVGGLPIMGLNSTWNDNTRANNNVPPLNQAWQYGKMPIRGMNLGGWLSIEPFITPSLFNSFNPSDNVVDEWTLCQNLGSGAAKTIEEHYSSFINEQTFADIQAAGFDHVRVPYSYWAVTTYPGDPYVFRVSWRYLLRGLEWARKYGLRINLDLHGLPGSQNGWNHSGHQGLIGWLNGTDGQLNAQRSLDIHQQLTTFFAQPRYKNLITMYGLVNEPRMVLLDTDQVLNWSASAISIVRQSGMPNETVVVIGDGFLGITNWQGKLPQESRTNVLLDAHQYVIFNSEQINLNHSSKMSFACDGWTQQTQQSMDPETGFGNFLCGEWSQADTDCVTYLNNVGAGTRWQGTLNTGNASTSVLTPDCPTQGTPPCDCTPANADPSDYSAEYKTWLKMFAEAQMHSYEYGWGWFYWTWKTESATQWSYQLGMAAGILPTNAQTRDFSCGGNIPDFAGAGLPDTY